MKATIDSAYIEEKGNGTYSLVAIDINGVEWVSNNLYHSESLIKTHIYVIENLKRINFSYFHRKDVENEH